jgi:hypothetical protein
MIKKLRNQPYAPKWEQRGRKKNQKEHIQLDQMRITEDKSNVIKFGGV